MGGVRKKSGQRRARQKVKPILKPMTIRIMTLPEPYEIRRKRLKRIHPLDLRWGVM